MSSSGGFSIQSQTGGEHGGLLVIASRNEHRNVTAMHANARLIAAAPDLLAALQELVAEAVEVWEYAEDYAHIERARAVIAKALAIPA